MLPLFCRREPGCRPPTSPSAPWGQERFQQLSLTAPGASRESQQLRVLPPEWLACHRASAGAGDACRFLLQVLSEDRCPRPGSGELLGPSTALSNQCLGAQAPGSQRAPRRGPENASCTACTDGALQALGTRRPPCRASWGLGRASPSPRGCHGRQRLSNVPGPWVPESRLVRLMLWDRHGDREREQRRRRDPGRGGEGLGPAREST